MKPYLLWLAVAACCTACTATQETAPADPPSTVVNQDGTVTFNYRNDQAKQVAVDVQFAGRKEMHRDSLTGIWTVTVGPAAPDIYPYHFEVDGLSVMDPQCSEWFPNEGFKNSLLDFADRSDSTSLYSLRNVAHGNVEYIQYYSEAIGTYNNAVVYLPPSYTWEAREYPVFYLISGTTDTEEVYYKVGRINNIMDNLIGKGEIEPLIVVMPYGNPAKLATAPDKVGHFDLFGQDLLNSLMPYIDSHYRTYHNAQDRAIGGFSRGGNQALMIGLTHLDKFSYLCSYSSFTSTALPKVYDKAADTNSKVKLLWSGVGTDDFLYGNARDYTEFLDKKGIHCVKEYTDDKFGHTWMNARYFLLKTLPLLFNQGRCAGLMNAAQPTKAKTGNEQQFTPGVMARLFPRPVLSPEFEDADKVTFRIKAPEAQQVMLEGEMLEEPKAMVRDSDGVWSTTLTLKPDVYCYNFVVDGTQVCDPQNMYLAPENGFKHSVLHMPSDPYDINKFKGEYAPVCYQTKHETDGTLTRQIVITPHVSAGTNMQRINLISSPESGYTFESWYKIANVNVLLEQMVAQQQCKPYALYLTEKPIDGAQITLNIADYKTWSEARQALIETLKHI